MSLHFLAIKEPQTALSKHFVTHGCPSTIGSLRLKAVIFHSLSGHYCPQPSVFVLTVGHVSEKCTGCRRERGKITGLFGCRRLDFNIFLVFLVQHAFNRIWPINSSVSINVDGQNTHSLNLFISRGLSVQ